MDDLTKLGRAELSDEQVLKYSYSNNINTLGVNFFDTKGIKEALYNLVIANKNPDIYMNPEFRVGRDDQQPASFRPKIPGKYKRQYLRPLLIGEVEIFFNKVEYELTKNHDDKKPWWIEFNDSLVSPLSEIRVPCGLRTTYYYGPSGKEFSKPELFPKKEPFQGFCYLFDDAIYAFSCFVSGDIKLEGWWSNISSLKPGEALIHENRGWWGGDLNVFLRSAGILETTFDNLRRHKFQHTGFPKGEIKLIHPQLGMISMKSEPNKIEDYSWEKGAIRDLYTPNTAIFTKKAMGLLMDEINN